MPSRIVSRETSTPFGAVIYSNRSRPRVAQSVRYPCGQPCVRTFRERGKNHATTGFAACSRRGSPVDDGSSRNVFHVKHLPVLKAAPPVSRSAEGGRRVPEADAGIEGVVAIERVVIDVGGREGIAATTRARAMALLKDDNAIRHLSPASDRPPSERSQSAHPVPSVDPRLTPRTAVYPRNRSPMR